MVERPGLREFVCESNRIEGILRDPTLDEIQAAERFMILFQVHPTTMGLFQEVVAPGKPLRVNKFMNVRVGNYAAPPGGPNIGQRLQIICDRANRGDDPLDVHIQFEMLHPYLDGNGRTGRMLWAWQMHNLGREPFSLPFLHRFYYQTLEARAST